jgi:hypothetical protein
MLAMAFAPISLFFLVTAPHYGFFKLLNVTILGLSAIVGLRFLTGGMRVLHAHGLLSPAKDPEPAPAVVAEKPAAVAAEEKTPVTVGAPVANGDGAAAPAVAAPAPAPPVLLAQPVAEHRVWDPVSQRYRVARPAGVAVERPASMTLLYIWILLFGFVGTQLAWTLRPFFGNPDSPFALFREIEGNFYAEIIRTIANL